VRPQMGDLHHARRRSIGVEDHRARLDRPQDPKAGDGYVREDYSIAEFERAGFRRPRSSEASL
jgi:hypothetical protein